MCLHVRNQKYLSKVKERESVSEKYDLVWVKNLESNFHGTTQSFSPLDCFEKKKGKST